MSFLLALAVLSGPPFPSQATLPIRIHLGANRESDVIRAELACTDEWFLSRWLRIEANYRIVLIDDLYKLRPAYEIGRGGERQEFRRGTFLCSGSFLTALTSIADRDRWERDAHHEFGITYDPFYGTHPDEIQPPEVFPPEEPE